MKFPAVQLAAPAQDAINPQLTLSLAEASLAAYYDYQKQPFKNPTNYQAVARWTGWDEIVDGFGYEERFGLLFRSTLPGSQTYIFAFRGTDTDLAVCRHRVIFPLSGQCFAHAFCRVRILQCV